MTQLSREKRMRDCLTANFTPLRLEITDESRKHRGHAGAQPEGETHYRLLIVSREFDDLSRIERQRRVQQALQEEWQSGLHALSIKAYGLKDAPTNT